MCKQALKREETKKIMSKKKIYALKPNWCRQLHRFHLLGKTQVVYRNQNACILERKTYPIHVTNVLEKSSNSLSGEHLWQINNWSKGYAIVDEGANKAILCFKSTKGDFFHSLHVNESSHWDCLECLLNLFGKRISSIGEQAVVKSGVSVSALTKSSRQLSAALEDSIQGESQISCTLFASGGICVGKYNFNDIRVIADSIEVSSAKAKLVISPEYVSHFNRSAGAKNFRCVLYTPAGLPSLIIEKP